MDRQGLSMEKAMDVLHPPGERRKYELLVKG